MFRPSLPFSIEEICMRYKVRVMLGREVLLEGTLETPKKKGPIVTPAEPQAQRPDTIAFALERAINAETDYRCHIEAVE